MEGPASGISGYIVVSGARASAGLEGRNEGKGGNIMDWTYDVVLVIQTEINF